MLLEADWNNDGNLDIMYSAMELDPITQSFRANMTFYVNNGFGNFTVVLGAIAVPSTYVSITNVISCDLDNDGFNDVIGKGYYVQTNSPFCFVHLNMNGTSFSSAFEITTINSDPLYVFILFTFEGHSHYCSLDACAQVMC